MKAFETLEDEIQVVAFKLGNEEYGIDILAVQEIIKVLNITRVPRAGQFIEGVINLRGNVIPVFSLHNKFKLIPTGKPDEARIIVFEFDEIKGGIRVDGVSEVIRINSSSIEDTSSVYGSLDSDFINGVAKINGRLLILLNLKKLLGID
ncbi:MAG: chemotaxis protein CheW [Chitinophagales bacterium]